MSGPESDAEDAEDLRLKLDVSEAIPKNSTPVVKEEVSEEEENTSTKDKLGRKTSQTLAEAFLEQLPEVKNNEEEISHHQSNGSAVSPC